MFLAPCQVLVDCTYWDLFLGSLLCFTGLCVYLYTSAILFWLISVYSMVWYQEVWFLQFCSVSVLWWLSGPYGSTHILWFFCEKFHWHFDRDCVESISDLSNMHILTILILLIHGPRISFHLLVSSSIYFIKLLWFPPYRFLLPWLIYS